MMKKTQADFEKILEKTKLEVEKEASKPVVTVPETIKTASENVKPTKAPVEEAKVPDKVKPKKIKKSGR